MKLLSTPYPYQDLGSRVMAAQERTINADEMGLGKTIQSLATLCRNPEWLPAVVVCPASLKDNWVSETKTHTTGSVYVCEGREPPSEALGIDDKPDLYIVNYDILSGWVDWLSDQGVRSLFLDECHVLGNLETQRTQACRTLARQLKYVVALSGTPIQNRPKNLYPVLNMLWPLEFDSFWDYGQEYCNARLKFGRWDYDGSSNMDDLHRRLEAHGMVRRTKAQVLPELPEKIRKMVVVPLRDRAEYDLCKTDYEAWLSQYLPEKKRNALKAKALTHVGYLVRTAARLKLKSVVQWTHKWLEEHPDEKILLFGYHHKAIKVLQEKIRAKSIVITGKTSRRKRDAYVKQFQNDPDTRVGIGNLQAMGVGLTLTAASAVGMVELYHRPIDHMQAEDRAHRIGQHKKTNIFYFVGENTIEIQLCEKLQLKQDDIQTALDGKGIGQIPDFNLYQELAQELMKGAL